MKPTIVIPKKLSAHQREDLKQLYGFYARIAMYCFINVLVLIFITIVAITFHPIVAGVAIVLAIVLLIVGKYNESNAHTIEAILFADQFNNH